MKIWLPVLLLAAILVVIHSSPEKSASDTIRNDSPVKDTTELESSSLQLPNHQIEDSLQMDSTRQEASTIQKDSMDILHFPTIEYCDGPLRVARNGETISLPNLETLMPGDAIETGSNQFAVLRFPDSWLMIVHPHSRITLSKDRNALILNDANVHVEMDSRYETEPRNIEMLQCFDARIAPITSSQSISFGLQCRGESGISVTSQSGAVALASHDRYYEISSGNALVGRATSDKYQETPQPDQPKMIIASNSNIESQTDEVKAVRFNWQSVSMADQYLIHIYQEQEDPIKHKFRIQRTNEYTTSDIESGSYFFRVLAIDYYGVSGSWSEPVPFQVTTIFEESETSIEEERKLQPELRRVPEPGMSMIMQ